MPPTVQGPSASAVDQTRITTAASGDVVPRDLKTVYLPRESLPRFLNVAAVNTARNRETCGLLLGKDRKSRFVVTTLLIPKQHSTSDTCTMDHEELVMNFTEERSLITLGWVRILFSCWVLRGGFILFLPDPYASDPVVLHVLRRPPHPLWFPENVAGIVCRCLCTNFNTKVSGLIVPLFGLLTILLLYSFGIFRLTDPPGLQTILDCTQKEAFHPHPTVPIYTVRPAFLPSTA
jgi:STAM-binding protein